MKLSRYKTIEIIKATRGKIFSCLFIKKDGSKRKMIARLGVRKNLKGGRNGVGQHNNLITVYDMVKRAYRIINLETILVIAANGKQYEIL